MTNKNNVVGIVKTIDEQVIDNAWKRVQESLNTVLTLDKVNQKPLQRTGKVMQRALNDLFFFLTEYDGLRNRK